MKDKSILYSRQQHDIITKLFHILDLNDDNQITLHDLDRDARKQHDLLEQLPEIRRWFAFGQIVGASDPEKMKRPWLSLIRQIIGKEYSISSVDIRIKVDNKTVRTKNYTFQKKN